MGDDGAPRLERRALLVALGSVLIAGCVGGDEAASTGPTLLEVVRSDAELSYVQRGVDAASMAEELETGGPYTLFVPNDEACVSFLRSNVFSDEIPDEGVWEFARSFLGDVIHDQVVRGRFRRDDFPQEALATLKGSSLRVGADGTVTDGQGRAAHFVGEERLARNGVVHVVDSVLLSPPQPIAGPMRTLIEEDRFSTLAAMIDTLLSGTTNRYPLLQMAPYTFFAPTDDAFERLFTALGTTRESFIRQDRSTLYRWLAGHEHARRLLSADVRLGYPVHVWGGVIKLEREGDTLVAYGQASSRARITTADIDDGTSIVHIVDGVLQWTFDDARSSLQKETGFSIAARVIGECDEQVSHDEWGEIWTLNAGTVLAPTDAAFAAYFEERGITEAQFFSLPAVERTDLFRYHLLLDQQLFAELVAGSPLTTKNGASFTVDASRVVTDRIGGTANIVRTDWLHYEGVIHAIDRVLRPG